MSRSHDCGTIISFLLSSMLLATPALANFSGPVVIAILDGDTIEVLHNNRAERIRLNGIDCPERGQACSQRASLRRWLGLQEEGQSIRPRGTTADQKVLD